MTKMKEEQMASEIRMKRICQIAHIRRMLIHLGRIVPSWDGDPVKRAEVNTALRFLHEIEQGVKS